MCVILKEHKGRGLEPRVELRSLLNRISRNWTLKDEWVREQIDKDIESSGKRVCKDTKE